MTDNEDDKTINVAGKKTLSLKPSGVQQGTVRQDMGRGRTKAVVVETRTKRHFSRPGEERQASAPAAPVQQRQPEPQQTRPAPQPSRP
ncbi:translation initiation factor IF-2 associated domain-containing protein, partial [Shinella sp.]